MRNEGATCADGPKGKIKKSLHQACHNKEEVRWAFQTFCHQQNRGRYKCSKEWKCKRIGCMGCIEHDCIVNGIKKGIKKEEVSELKHQDSNYEEIYNAPVDSTIEKPYKPIYPVEKLCVNSTSGDEIKDKLKKACRRDKSVYMAQKYCTKVKKGKYFCIKNWKCLKYKNFCTGCVKHQCEIYGQYQNVTINLVLEKQNKSTGKIREEETFLNPTIHAVLHHVLHSHTRSQNLRKNTTTSEDGSTESEAYRHYYCIIKKILLAHFSKNKPISGHHQKEDSGGNKENKLGETAVLDITVEQMTILQRKWCTKISNRNECAKICNTFIRLILTCNKNQTMNVAEYGFDETNEMCCYEGIHSIKLSTNGKDDSSSEREDNNGGEIGNESDKKKELRINERMEMKMKDDDDQYDEEDNELNSPNSYTPTENASDDAFSDEYDLNKDYVDNSKNQNENDYRNDEKIKGAGHNLERFGRKVNNENFEKVQVSQSLDHNIKSFSNTSNVANKVYGNLSTQKNKKYREATKGEKNDIRNSIMYNVQDHQERNINVNDYDFTGHNYDLSNQINNKLSNKGNEVAKKSNNRGELTKSQSLDHSHHHTAANAFSSKSHTININELLKLHLEHEQNKLNAKTNDEKNRENNVRQDEGNKVVDIIHIKEKQKM